MLYDPTIIFRLLLLEYNYIINLGKTDLIKDKGRTTYVRQKIYKLASVGQSADRRRLLEHLKILKDNLVNLLDTIVLHSTSDTDRIYFVKLNIIFLYCHTRCWRRTQEDSPSGEVAQEVEDH